MTMVVIYCYLEIENDKIFKFHLNNSSYFEINVSSLFKRYPLTSAVPESSAIKQVRECLLDKIR